MICPLMLVSRKVVKFNANPGSTVVKNLPALQEMQVQSLGWEDLLTEEPGRIEFMGSQTVGQN